MDGRFAVLRHFWRIHTAVAVFQYLTQSLDICGKAVCTAPKSAACVT
jgi:hypothetical protein